MWAEHPTIGIRALLTFKNSSISETIGRRRFVRGSDWLLVAYQRRIHIRQFASTTQLTTAAGVRGRWSASLRSNKRCSGELEKYAIEVTESLLYAVIGASSYSAFLCRNLEGGSSGKINVEMVDAMPYHLPRILLVRLALNYDGLFRPAHRERPAVDR